MMKVLKFFFTSLCILFLQACDDDGSASDNVNPTPRCEENDPNCLSFNTRTSPIPEEVYDFGSESYADGDVVTFDWPETLEWFLESSKNKYEDYKYGYDRDPYSIYSDEEAPLRGKDVYISVIKNKDAYVRIRLDPNTKKDFHLHRINKDKTIKDFDVISASEICENKDCTKDIPLKEGSYAIYHGDEDIERYLHIIPYSLESPREIHYVEFGKYNSPGCVDENKHNGCYTKDIVEKRFNEIMFQAIVQGRLTEIAPSEINLDESFTVDVSIGFDPSDVSDHPISDQIFETINLSESYGYGNEENDFVDFVNVHGENCDNDCSNEVQTLYNNYKRKYNQIKNKHIVLALNQMRIQWTFSAETSKLFYSYLAFKKALEYEKKDYLPMILESECGGGKRNIQLKAKNPYGNTFEPEFIGAGTFEKNCIYNVYADVHPFIPDMPLAAQVTHTFDINLPYELVQGEEDGKEKKETEKDKDRVVTGGIVWGSHGVGDVSVNTIVHEIGHTYGLTDLFIAKDDPSYVPNYQYKPFAFDEGNLMGWQNPTGKRIRYRPLFIAETSNGKLIPLSKDQYATESQWECMRSYSNCSKKKKTI